MSERAQTGTGEVKRRSEVFLSVRVRGLTKRFGEVIAVDRLDLEAEPGELLAVVGPSGCGKTTLLRMVAGLERPDEGSIEIDGKDVTRLAPEKRNVGIVFQNFALFPHMTVEENIGYGLRRQGVPRSERSARVQEMLAMIGLPDLGRRKPNELSAGQQQRVALARSMAPRPKTLLLDEPLSALDAELRERLRLEIRQMQRQLGITTLFVTHDQEEALATADRVAVMDRGRIEQIGDPWSLYDRPGTPFVARFVGRGNYFEAHVDETGARVEGLGHIPRRALPSNIPSDKALVLLRPETIQWREQNRGQERVQGGEGRMHEDGQGTAQDSLPGSAQGSPQERADADHAVHVETLLTDVVFEGDRCTLVLKHESGREWVVTAPGRKHRYLSSRVGTPMTLSVSYDDFRWIPVR